MPVTVRNYMFPIIFTYKGWVVTLNDASSFFQSSDVKVKVSISVDRQPYNTMLLNAIQQQSLKYQQYSYGFRKEPNNSSQILEQYKQISQAVKDFLDTKKTIEYVEKANGGMLDRFLGQNLSGIEKVQQKVKTYIDSNLGPADFRDELVAFLQQRGL